MPHSFGYYTQGVTYGQVLNAYGTISAMDVGGIFMGFVLIAMGLVTLKFNRSVAGMLGTPAFLTKYFGPGREYTFYVLFSFGLIFLGLFVMFGLFGIITDLIFKPFRGLVR